MGELEKSFGDTNGGNWETVKVYNLICTKMKAQYE